MTDLELGEAIPMPDLVLTCRDCGASFSFPENQQRFYAEHSLATPQRCVACRNQRKNERIANRHLFDAVCAQCGEKCQIPFAPRPIEEGGRPVLCLVCFKASRFDDSLRPSVPILIKAIICPYGKTAEGTLIKAVAVPWRMIAQLLEREPHLAYQIPPEKWEELVACAFDQAGYDEVTLTPRSGDFGRDVIVVRRGVGSIRIIGSVKAYKPGHLVKHDDVRALLGVLHGDRQASKAILTTTSDFAPRIASDPFIAPFIPYRLELMNGKSLVRWMNELVKRGERRTEDTLVRRAEPGDAADGGA